LIFHFFGYQRLKENTQRLKENSLRLFQRESLCNFKKYENHKTISKRRENCGNNWGLVMKKGIRVGAVSPSIKGDRFKVMKKYVERQDLDLIVFPEEFFGTDFVTDKPTYIPLEDVVREVWFPELSRIAALKGAEIICFPTGTDINVKKDKAWLTLWWARAIENDVYVVQSINAKGSVTSVICSPEKILAIGRKEGMITAELDMDKLKKIREGSVKTRIESALLKRRSPFLRKIGETMISNTRK
jgi:hypothetical protein